MNSSVMEPVKEKEKIEVAFCSVCHKPINEYEDYFKCCGKIICWKSSNPVVDGCFRIHLEREHSIAYEIVYG